MHETAERLLCGFVILFVPSRAMSAAANSLYVSTDQGRHFEPAPALPVFGATGGRVAVSATSERTLWTVAGQGTYYTDDRGATWHRSEGLPDALVRFDGSIFRFNQPLASDRVLGDTFYAYKEGKFYRSDDGGATFQTVFEELPKREWHYVQAAPGIGGEVWVALEDQGLWRSSDGGNRFSRVEAVNGAHLFAFGKGLTPDVPSVYVFGKVLGTVGIFRSDDLGQTWVKIDVPSPTGGNEPNLMAGDRQVHGRVYIGTNGTGIYYGEPVR